MVYSQRGLYGPKLGEQIMFRSGLGLGLVQMVEIRHYLQHFGLSQTIFCKKKKVIQGCALLMHMKQSGSGDISQ
jgi:hypothetical protein